MRTSAYLCNVLGVGYSDSAQGALQQKRKIDQQS